MYRGYSLRISYLILILVLIFVQIPKNLYHACESQHETACDHSNSDENDTYSISDDDCLVCSFDTCFEAVVHYVSNQTEISLIKKETTLLEDSANLSVIQFKQLRAPPVTLS